MTTTSTTTSAPPIRVLVAKPGIVVFDPETVIDKGMFQDPAQYSEGVEHVLVNGVVSLRDGAFVEGVTGGRAVKAPTE